MNLLLRQKQNKVSQRISVCKISNSVDIVHINISKVMRGAGPDSELNTCLESNLGRVEPESTTPDV